MKYIVVVRLQNGSLIAIEDKNDNVHEWPSIGEAKQSMRDHVLGNLPYEVVEVGI